MKKLSVLVSVAIVFVVSAIVFRSVRGFDRRLPKTDDSQLEEPAVLGEINFKAGFQNDAETNPLLTTVLLRDKPTLLELERLGRVPEGADERTWRLCESTSWWGKQLDSDAFWSNRVIWLSFEAEKDANSHGRLYPPIPPGETRFIDRSEIDRGGSPLQTWEIRCRAYYHSDRERVFWDWFSKNRPRSPDKIDQALSSAHRELMILQTMPLSRPTGLTIPLPSQDDEENVLSDEYVARGFPREAFSPKVIKWEYVSRKRHEYQRILEQPGNPEFATSLAHFTRTLECSVGLVENSPSDEELRVTRGWRIDYLRRLRREGTDESYIEAYKKAWNLSEDDLQEEKE